MYIDAELVTKSYSPRRLKEGMLFIDRKKDPPQIYELEKDVVERESYITENGHPIELCLIEHTNKPSPQILACADEIGWVDEGEDSEDMHTITIEDINSILGNNNRCQIKIKDKLYEKEKMIIPVYDEEKVIIRLIGEE